MPLLYMTLDDTASVVMPFRASYDLYTADLNSLIGVFTPAFLAGTETIVKGSPMRQPEVLHIKAKLANDTYASFMCNIFNLSNLSSLIGVSCKGSTITEVHIPKHIQYR